MLFAEGNPGGIKAACHILGLMENELRLPLVPISTELHKKLEKQIALIQSAGNA
jgi:4-hydroxy-tetrahydrodipicolinate synthase